MGAYPVTLCDVVAEPLSDPFATEVIAVPTRGIERWLTQRIASDFAERGLGDGIAANIDFPFPGRVVRDVLRQVPATQSSIEAWTRQAIVFHLQQTIDDHRDEDWMRLISRFVEGPNDERSGAQRLRAAQKIARLFSSYCRYRPSMIDDWSRGEDVGPEGNTIDDGKRLHPKRPGALDLPAWAIGRRWCRPANPDCDACPIGHVCPRFVQRGAAVTGA